MSKAIFVTATGTDTGKTFVSALLVKKLHEASLVSGYYKPALSGLEVPVLSDAEYVKSIARIPQTVESMLTYTYQKAVSPHLAAQLEGNPPELATIQQVFRKLNAEHEYLTVEGCGGIICPLRYDHEQQLFLTDVIQALGLNTVVVTNAALGTINTTMLTINYLKQQGIGVLGLIINNYQAHDPMQQDNKKMLAELSGLPLIALVPPHAQDIDIEARQLAKLYKIPEVK